MLHFRVLLELLVLLQSYSSATFVLLYCYYSPTLVLFYTITRTTKDSLLQGSAMLGRDQSLQGHTAPVD